MKKSLVFIGIVIAGGLAYWSGYQYVDSKDQPIPFVSGERELWPVKNKNYVENRFYILKIDGDMLSVYQMPSERLYDSVKLSTLHLEEEEYTELFQGIKFETLTEVFEFLENSMS